MPCFFLTHLPPSGIPASIEGLDKLAHFLGYSVLGFLLFAVRKPEDQALGKTVLILALYSLFDEATQPLVGRDFELWDIAADLLGATSGAWLFQKSGLGK